MPASSFEYLVGTTWTAETNYIRMEITDNLYLPLALKVTIADNNANTLNARQSVYTRYQKVRVIEGNSGRLIFNGKIERILPHFDGEGGYGQTVELVCYDNLNELLKQEMNEDATYGSSTTRSAIIEDIINGGGAGEFTAHAWQGSPLNIGTSDTDKFVASGTPLAGGDGNTSLTGSSKTPLRVIEELALEDKQTTNTHLSGHDYFLDFEFSSLVSDKSSSDPQPDLNYHSRGTVPETPATYGLTLQYQGTDTALVDPIFANYNFPRQGDEIITKVRTEYVSSVDTGRAPTTKEVIMINHGAITGGTFSVDDVITWNTTKTAIVAKVMEDNRGLLISSNGDNTWLDVISGFGIDNGSGQTATVNATTDSIPDTGIPPGSIREVISQDIQAVVIQYENETITKIMDRASTLLQSGGDIVFRGNVSVLKWPYHVVTGTNTGASATVLTDSGAQFIKNGIRVGDEVQNTTDSITGLITGVTATTITVSAGGMSWATNDVYEIYVMNRAGHSTYVKDMPPTDIADQTAVITQIVYTEGPGVQRSDIELLLLANDRGIGLPKNSVRNIASTAKDGTFQNPGAVGVRDITSMIWYYSGSLSTPTADQVDWSSGTLTLSDGRTFAIDAGNSGTLEATEYLYFDIDSPTIFTSSATLADVIGIDRLFIAQFVPPTSGTTPEYIVYGTMATPIQIDGTAITNFDTSIQGWTQEIGLSSTDADTVSWAGGNITLTNGDIYVIAAGNTGNMVARTYIYLDINTSTTVLQTSTTASDAVGSGKILVATAKNETGEATFFTFSGDAKTKVNGPDIVTNSIDTNQIKAGAITADEILAGTITANEILANTITAGLLTSDLVLTTKITAGVAGAGRWEMSSSGVIGYNTSNAEQVRLITTNDATGGKIIAGGSGTEKVAMDVDGLQVIGTGGQSVDFRDTFNGSVIGELGLNPTNLILTVASKDLHLFTTTAGDIKLFAAEDIVLAASGDVILTGNFIPNTGNQEDLGATGKNFDGIWANTVKTALLFDDDIGPTLDNTINLGTGSTAISSAYMYATHTDNLYALSGGTIIQRATMTPVSGGAVSLGSATLYYANVYSAITRVNTSLDFEESSDPGNSATNTAYMYLVQEAGSPFKSELYVRFQSGAAVLIAAEP